MFDVLSFWLAVALLGALLASLPAARERWVYFALIASSAFVLVAVVGVPWWAMGFLGATAVWIPWGLKRRLSVPVLFAPVAVLWIAAKLLGGWSTGPLAALLFIGFSFVLVKVWTLVRDAQSGRMPPPNAAAVLAYLLHFPTYIAGPMHYYGEFTAAVAARRYPTASEFIHLVFRVLLGLVKTKVCVPLLAPAGLVTLPAATNVTPSMLVLSCVVYSIVIYLDFSGYSDLAIGASRLLGIGVPENFRSPYLARNIRDFWQRWHITFSRALTSYVFVPLSRVLDRRGTSRTTVMVVAYLVTFAFCGFWHGAAINFILWGLYHAAGLIAYDRYRERQLRRKLSKPAAAEPGWRRKGGEWLSIAGTFAFVSVGWIFFALSFSDLLGVVQKLLRS